jgi:NAD(P)-dependent dehydrogenase (short-subunit alcohol dehydrogenase family)
MINNNNKKVALVTGATGAIGKAIAHQLAARNFHVIMAVRDAAKAQKVVEEIIDRSKNPYVKYELVDLALQSNIQALVDCWKGPLNVLVNNAAVTPRTRQETAEGIEMMFATNVLGYFRMTLSFRDVLSESAPARIIDVASYWAGGLDSQDLEFKSRRYNNGTAYRQSKQANRMLVAAWSERLKSMGITINACHPGDVNSTLSHNLGFGGSQTPAQGAETPVWLATSPTIEGITGRYFEYRKEASCRFSEDSKAVETLFKLCWDYQG